MDFDTVKALGILGAALMIASVVLTPVSWLVGAVLVLLSLYYLGQAYGVRSVFDYALYGLIFAFVPAFLVPLMIVGFFGFMPMFMPMHMPGNWPFAPFAGFWILVFLVVFVMLVLSGFFFYRSMDVLASRSGVELFRVAGMLTLIGAATLILFLLGFILILASWVILAVAFYSLKKPPSGVQV